MVRGMGLVRKGETTQIRTSTSCAHISVLKRAFSHMTHKVQVVAVLLKIWIPDSSDTTKYSI